MGDNGLGPTMGGGYAVVSVSDLSCTFTTPAETVYAVRDVTLTASAGDFVCITGASGSGKSTLLSLLSGIRAPDAGSIQVQGRELVGLSVEERSRVRLESIGVVFQDDNLIDEFTAAENVAFPLELLGRSKRAMHEAADLLARVGLEGLGQRFPSELSGGQRQRVGIARALVGSRTVLLTDEPTGALDAANSRALFELLRDLAADGAVVIMACHDELALQFASRRLSMSDGHLDGT